MTAELYATAIAQYYDLLLRMPLGLSYRYYVGGARVISLSGISGEGA